MFWGNLGPCPFRVFSFKDLPASCLELNEAGGSPQAAFCRGRATPFGAGRLPPLFVPLLGQPRSPPCRPPQPLRTSSSPTSSLGWGQAPGSVGEGRPSARQAGACWTAAPLCVGGPGPPVRGRCVPSLSLVLPLSVSFPSRAQPPSWDTQAHPQVSHGCPSHRCPPRGPAARALMHTCQRWNRRSTQEPGPLTPAAGSRPDPEQELP